jgi:hypothetical protein
MTGGIIAENQAGELGGGVYMMDGGVLTKEPLTPGGSSGVIYGYSGDNPGSNQVKSNIGTEDDKGHAVYIASEAGSPKKRETTVGPDQSLNSTQDGTGGWAE